MQKIRRKGRRPTIRSILVANAQAPNPMSMPDLAYKYGYDKASMWSVQTRLRREGILPHAAIATGPRIHPQEPFSPDRLAEEAAAVGPPAEPTGLRDTPAPDDWPDVPVSLNSIKIATELEWLQRLSYLLRYGSEAISLAAAKALQDIARSTTSAIGPPAPMTEEQRVARLARIMIAVGQKTTDAAQSVAFAPKEALGEAASSKGSASAKPSAS